MKIKKGDKVLIVAGKDRGKTGTVLRCLPKEKKIIIEGRNLITRHVRPRKEGEKGQRIKVPAPLSVSNAKLICPKCKKATRIGFSVEKGGKAKKRRICKKCKSFID